MVRFEKELERSCPFPIFVRISLPSEGEMHPWAMRNSIFCLVWDTIWAKRTEESIPDRIQTDISYVWLVVVGEPLVVAVQGLNPEPAATHSASRVLILLHVFWFYDFGTDHGSPTSQLVDYIDQKCPCFLYRDQRHLNSS